MGEFSSRIRPSRDGILRPRYACFDVDLCSGIALCGLCMQCLDCVLTLSFLPNEVSAYSVHMIRIKQALVHFDGVFGGVLLSLRTDGAARNMRVCILSVALIIHADCPLHKIGAGFPSKTHGLLILFASKK